MKTEHILQLPSMPLQSPSFPRGPYRFTHREYLVVQYRSCPDAIRHALPEPLEPDGDVVAVQWLDLPDGTGLGGYSAKRRKRRRAASLRSTARRRGRSTVTFQ
jgi:acetoacetate decarboxylase